MKENDYPIKNFQNVLGAFFFQVGLFGLPGKMFYVNIKHSSLVACFGLWNILLVYSLEILW